MSNAAFLFLLASFFLILGEMIWRGLGYPGIEKPGVIKTFLAVAIFTLVGLVTTLVYEVLR